MGVQSREQIVAQVERRVAREYTDQEIRAEEAVLKRLGLLPADLDYKATVLALLQDQVAGYYDPLERRLHLADWLPVALQEPALSHEICHALQDQHFGMKRFVKPIKDNTDQQLAQVALVEGDCTGVMLEYTLAPQGLDLGHLDGKASQAVQTALATGGSPKLQSAPRFLRETLLFPYVHGLAFIQGIRAIHPWSAVSKIFSRPPATTEQVLHPEKYWRREGPVSIRMRTAPPALTGYERVRQDTLGEFQLSLFLAQGVGAEVAARAAAGWGGDRLLAYQRSGADAPPLLVHITTWDSEADALEFSDASRQVLARRKMELVTTAGASGLWVYRDSDGAEWSVQRVREHVLLLDGVPSEARAPLQKEVWEAVRIGGRKVAAK
jgi:hypothetical protein